MNVTQQQDLTELTVELLSAFVANNAVRSDDLPGLSIWIINPDLLTIDIA